MINSGTLNGCSIWRRVTLLSVPRKIVAEIIIKWIANIVDQEFRKEQLRFRNGNGCTDQIFYSSQHFRQRTEWKRQLCVNFYKAVDSIHRDSLLRGILLQIFYHLHHHSYFTSHMRYNIYIGLIQV